MNDEAIKKALVCCLVDDCMSCPIIRFHDCRTMLKNETISLLNRQQAGIEKLRWEKDHFEFKVDDLNGKLEKFKEYIDIKNGADERKIERLQAEIKQAKTEARKEFAAELISALKIDEFGWFEEESERLVKAINELAEGSEIKCQ